MKILWSETVNPRKVCSVGKHLGIDAEYEHVDLAKGAHKQPDFLAKNPNGRVPVLVDGDLVLFESAAICAYLAARAGSSLWPVGDARGQAEVLKFLSWQSAHSLPAFGPFYFEYAIKPMLGLGAPDAARLAQATPQFHAVAKVLDGLLEGRRWLVDGRLTLADFVVGAVLPDWKAHAMPLEGYANVRRWLDESLLPIDAFREPWPR